MKKRLLSLLSAVAMLCGLAVFAPASALVENLRTGRHGCFDRLVVDLEGDVDGYSVQYVNRVTELGSGHSVPLSGGADLQIVVNAAAYDDGEATYSPRNPSHAVDVDGYRTFEQVAFAGSFEGQTLIGLGVRARLPMRVFTLDGPGDSSRLVIDVAHRW